MDYIRKSIKIAPFMILLGFVIGLAGNSRYTVQGYDYDTCTSLGDLAQRHCPEDVNINDFIQDVYEINGMYNYEIDGQRYYQYPVYIEQLNENEAFVITETDSPKKLKSLGIFIITAYCPCRKCCGKYSNGITSTGVKAQANHTVAVDPKKIPYGTHLIINGIEYVAEDCGSAIRGNRLDIYFDTHQEALNWGKRKVEVFTYDN